MTATLPVSPMTVTLPVNEVFETIQGEGSRTGWPAVFVRLQGCPVGCPWCDTKHTWEVDPAQEIDPQALLLEAEAASPSWAAYTAPELAQIASRFRARHVVLTGGEPCLHDLRALTALIITAGQTVQIETSGTQPIRVDPQAFVTLSPKIAMPGGFPVRDDALARANEIKMPIGKPADLAALFTLLDRQAHPPWVPIYLQPLSLSQKATQLCTEAAIANNFRVSIQTHAILGWR